MSYRVGHSTVGLIIKETCQALWTVLMPKVLKAPSTQQEWKEIAEDFHGVWNFPMCLGAVDGKHVVIQAPKLAGSEYFNYKRTHSIVLMAVCDARYCFTLIDIGNSGRHSDGGVFVNAEFGQRFIHGDLNMPSNGCLPGTNIVIPYCIVGDAAFPLRHNLMRPYPGRCLPHDKSVFNYRLSRARRVIENTFGILVTRRRILRRPIIADPPTVVGIVKAACCLHNFLQTRNSYASPYVDQEDRSGNVVNGQWRSEARGTNFQSLGRLGTNMHSRHAGLVRDIFKDYFTSEIGRLPWQDAIVSRS